MSVWFVTGAGDRLLAVALDVTDEVAAHAAAAAAVDTFGRIDVLVNNAGRGCSAAKTAFVAAEQAAWRDVSLSTDHDAAG